MTQWAEAWAVPCAGCVHLAGGLCTAKLTPALSSCFAHLLGLHFLRVCSKFPAPFRGCAEFVTEFEDPKDTPAPVPIKTRDERDADKVSPASSACYALEATPTGCRCSR